MTVPSDTTQKSIATGSGITWEKWVEFFTPHQQLDHTALAQLALDHITTHGHSTSPEWWAQSATIAFEQFSGRRAVGQRCDGSFSVTVSKTLAGDMDAALAHFRSVADALVEINGVPITTAATTSATEKWRYWRCGLADGARISVNFTTKPGGEKTALAVNHDKLPAQDELEATRAWWKALLATL